LSVGIVHRIQCGFGVAVKVLLIPPGTFIVILKRKKSRIIEKFPENF
jgi:hypothetical protein